MSINTDESEYEFTSQIFASLTVCHSVKVCSCETFKRVRQQSIAKYHKAVKRRSHWNQTRGQELALRCVWYTGNEYLPVALAGKVKQSVASVRLSVCPFVSSAYGCDNAVTQSVWPRSLIEEDSFSSNKNNGRSNPPLFLFNIPLRRVS